MWHKVEERSEDMCRMRMCTYIYTYIHIYIYIYAYIYTYIYSCDNRIHYKCYNSTYYATGNDSSSKSQKSKGCHEPHPVDMIFLAPALETPISRRLWLWLFKNLGPTATWRTTSRKLLFVSKTSTQMMYIYIHIFTGINATNKNNTLIHK